MVALSPRVTLVRAPNPSPMTLTGTNSYLVFGTGGALAVDPGPRIQEHVDAIEAAARERGATIEGILVTHGHPDHAPAAALLADRTGAPVYAHPDARFPHDRTLSDGERLALGDIAIKAIDAPGHTFDHLVFELEDERALFTGDVVIGEGFVVIAPPNAAMRPYQHTLERLARENGDAHRLYGGHGPEITDPRAKLNEYIAHRRDREQQLIAQLAKGEATIPELVEAIYAAYPRVLWPAAGRQLLAYLIALEGEGRVRNIAATRAPTDAERTILQPNLGLIADPHTAAVAAAEFGTVAEPVLDRYALVA